ncbi:MAG: 3'-5' exonuclease [Bacteroidota bacterium]
MIQLPLSNILFLDIETVSQQPAFEDLPDEWKQLWERKASLLLRNKETETPESIYGRAAIYAEFGKIICISCGIVHEQATDKKISLKSFWGHSEKQLLLDFTDMVNKWETGGSKYLCAHNGREFDFPYLCRRMLVHNITIPALLHTAGKKPWEVNHLDTMERWKFGDFKNYTSLNLLAHTLGVPTPKDDIDGSQVGETYWKEGDLARIVTYCQKDVVTVAQIYLRMQGGELIKNENIEIKI